MSKVLVIGGGPAGMFAAIAAAENRHTVTILEKNEKLGKKLFITGKGRCNITNSGDQEDFFANVMSNRKFLYSAFYACSNEQVIDFFEKNGLPLKNERGNRIFPCSDHSSDVIACLKRVLEKKKVAVRLHCSVKSIKQSDGHACGVTLSDGKELFADAVIVATGGLSYPATGSTGDGYQMAEECGHSLITATPSLVPFEIKEDWVKQLQGLSLKNVSIQICHGRKKIFEDFGEMLFTHFGVSGPMILSASGSIQPREFEKELSLFLDLKPALSEEQLDKRLLRDFAAESNRQYKNVLHKLFPSKLIPVMIAQSGIDPEKKVNEISKEERKSLAALTKHFPMTITGLRGFSEAIITKGGICVREINPSTMESKLCKGLYFCGEVLDTDALTGGYNLQIAWSTGYLAGCSIPEK